MSNYAIGRAAHYGRVGAHEVVGQQFRPLVGASEIIGAAANLSPSEAKAVAETILSRNSYGIQDRVFDKARTLVVGFRIEAIPNGAVRQALVQPQYPFRPHRLFIPSSIAPGFLINNITSGQQPILAFAGPLPAEAFSEVSVGVLVNWPTASIGNQISIEVLNRSGGAADFEAMMLGITGVD